MVTIVRAQGSTPAKAGAKMIVCQEGDPIGTVGGGRLEHELCAEARQALADGKPRVVKRHLTRDLAMCCGGEVEAFIDPVDVRERIVLVGGGHIHAALAPIVAQLGFEVILADELEEFASPGRFPRARLVHSFDPREWGVPMDAYTYVVVATREHATDQKVLEDLAAMDARPAYLGLVGSRGKSGKFRKRLEAKGVGADWIEQLRSPVGVDVGARTPAEIAVAIAAELVAVRQRPPRGSD